MAFRWVGGPCAFAWLLFVVSSCSSKTEQSTPASDAGGPPKVILDGGGVIPDAPPGQDLCQAGECNYQTQDCAGNAACIPSASPPASGDWPPTCAAPGTVAPGAACAGWSDCQAGSFCVGVGQKPDGGVEPGTCRRLCCGGDWSACPAGESCIQQLYLLRPGETEPVYAGADVCAPVGTCDVLDANSCADEPGRTCKIVDPTGNVACMPAGTTPIGSPCSSVTPCVAGASCIGGKCRRLCKAVLGGGEPSCPEGEGVCVHFAGNPEGVGECTPSAG